MKSGGYFGKNSGTSEGYGGERVKLSKVVVILAKTVAPVRGMVKTE